MIKVLFNILFIVWAVQFACIAQDKSAPDGYKLRKSEDIIFAYRNKDNKPDFSVRNQWDHKYWFKIDPSGTYADPTGNVEYVRVTIPSMYRWDDSDSAWTEETGYHIQVPWKADEFVDASDFRTWLWIRKSDFEALKVEYYVPHKFGFVLSALTVPFKYRPKLPEYPNSVINGDLNIGSLIGVRFTVLKDLGVNVGGHFGISSLAMNAANNTTLTGSTTETVQGFTYGYGIIFDLKQKFQIGVVRGYDYGTGSLAETYIYQRKSWFSFSLNYKFLDRSDEKESNEDKRKGKPN